MIRRPLRLAADRRRLAIPLLAGALVSIGVIALTGSGGDPIDADPTVDLVATLVADRPVAAGTPIAQLGDAIGVRMLPREARADGALGATAGLDDLAAHDGAIVTTDLVTGEQLLLGDIASDPVAAIADDYVAVSVRLDLQRWAGPYVTTGAEVDIYSTGTDTATMLIVADARIVAAPDAAELDPRSESVITLAVPAVDVTAVIEAAAAGTLWMVGS